MAATGNTSVPMVTGSIGTDPDPQVLCDRVKVCEQHAGSTIQSDSYLWNRIRELERSEKSLLLRLYQLASASHLPSMQHTQRLDQRLHMLREEVRTMTQDKERGERVWRERLQRCQRQLKAKEEEMSRQSQYFENFKAQLQHKLSLARDREQSLQNRIHTLEKQLLDMTVSAATGVATISAVRITAGTLTQWEEQERLLSMRGEGEGEEEKKEERRKQWQPNKGTEREGRQEGDERKTDIKENSNEARLQSFILSLQEDLRVLLEREESGMTEWRRLTEQLQEAQENSHFLCCKVEEMKAAVQQLKLSEISLMEEAEELREENHRLQQNLRDAANQTPSQSSTILESTYPSPGNSLLSCSPVVPMNTNPTGHYSDESCGKVQLILDEREGQSHSSAVVPVHHQAAAESTQNNTEDPPAPAKLDTLSSPETDSPNLITCLASKSNLSLKSLSATTETVDDFKLGTWCSRGVLNLEEIPSEESDALKEAYRSLGLGEDLEALQEQRGPLEAALQTQEQLQVMAQYNTELKSQLRKQAEEQETEAFPVHSNTILAQDNLVQALNQENRALANRIQELLAHIELREQEMKTEQTQQREHIFGLKEDLARLEQDNQEQGCLITELTRKTEDDLNTIMDLQQKLVESRECKEGSQVDKELCGSQWQSEYTAATSGSCQQNNLEEHVHSLVENLLKGDEEPQLMLSQQLDNLNTASALDCQHNKHNNALQNSPQTNVHVSSVTDEVDQLTKSVHSLKTEQEELICQMNSLREEQKEVALSVQTQTEEKQHLTRTVWGLKEEKDRISQSLVGIKQEREHLTRTVCGLKDERDQFIRSVNSLKEEKEHFIMCLSGHEREKEKLLESLSTGREEVDQTVKSLQSLQKESNQLSQSVLSLKLEREELTDSLKSLTEQRDQEQLSSVLQEDQDTLLKSVSSLKEEKERIEHSISFLKQEEKQTIRLFQGIREERNSLQTGFHSQTQTQEANQKHLLNQNVVWLTKKTENTVGTGDNAAHRCPINNYKENSKQEQSDLMREIEALGAKLKKSQEELDKSHIQTKRLNSELCQSEARREEAERRAAQVADEVMRLTDEANQMEETNKENDRLMTQVKELQSKLTGQVRENTNALSLKAQIEEEYNILTAQLKAKTVALEELNSEYIALKRGQGSRDDLSTVLMSLRTRYNNIKAKYEALLKKKSQTDLDIAPLKAKLSCLVVKCQESNSLLMQMMKVMHKQGCVDSTLMQQVEQLLCDTALQDYTAAFTPGITVKTQNHLSGFTPEFILKVQDYSGGFTPDQTFLAAIPPVNQHQNEFTTESGVKCGKSDKHSSIVTTEFTTPLHGVGDSTPTPTVKKNANLPLPTSPVQEHARVQKAPSPIPALGDGFSPNTTQLSSSASVPEKLGFPDKKALSSPDPTSSSEVRGGSSLSLAPPSSAIHVSPSRRLSSPEKIINLHEQLQKTLFSSYQAPVIRGRKQQSRKSLLFSAPADLSPTSQIKILSVNTPHPNHLPATSVSSQANHTPIVTTKPVATTKSTTLFNAVASRSANVSFSPDMFTKHCLKSDMSTITSALSSSSSSSINTVASSKDKSALNRGTNIPISPELKRQSTAIHNANHTATTTFNTVRSAATDSNVLIYLDTNPKTTASDTTAMSISTAAKASILSMTSNPNPAPAYDGLIFNLPCTQSAHCSPERSSKSNRKSPAAPEKPKTRPKPEAPADVCSVEVIKTVGQSSLLIGWERPPLDELGCSNGTFVYGYRVFVDGDFHKSVMSSACTKCILENVDLSVPLHLSVQTLGSNGLNSNSVHTMYRTSVSTDHN
ncbi:golgin subfamily B member 1-like [Scomber scombrus]|uniref:Golgin subfamily B member 1-like n=1 Tax=Scomber scombrus TaxID=13677 RepID=A0AAV1PJ68_SCOSC